MDPVINDLGVSIAKGIVSEIYKTILIIVVIGFILVLIRNTLNIGIDSTDKSSWKRSNLVIHTDNKTGVQYVATRNGLTVRVDHNGKPIIKP